MGIDEYADWAAATAMVSAQPATGRLSYLGLGLAAEVGEVADHIKKLLRDGRLDQAARVRDILLRLLCAAAGRKPSEVLEASQLKIGRKIAAS